MRGLLMPCMLLNLAFEHFGNFRLCLCHQMVDGGISQACLGCNFKLVVGCPLISSDSGTRQKAAEPIVEWWTTVLQSLRSISTRNVSFVVVSVLPEPNVGDRTAENIGHVCASDEQPMSRYSTSTTWPGPPTGCWRPRIQSIQRYLRK